MGRATSECGRKRLVEATGTSNRECSLTRVLCVAIKCLAPRFVGRKLSSLTSDFATTHRNFLGGQTRFMSPEVSPASATSPFPFPYPSRAHSQRGVMQLASNAILNAIWDLWAKVEGKPLWRLIADFTPEQLVSVIDFRYITDELTKEQALAMLKEKEKTKAERLELALQNKAVPGYNTSVGWLGLSDEEVESGLKKAVDEGFRHFKLKVGLGLDVDRKRLGMVRRIGGPEAVIMTDVNQLWDVDVSGPRLGMRQSGYACLSQSRSCTRTRADA
jgi:L-galactonate dehydratase